MHRCSNALQNSVLPNSASSGVAIKPALDASLLLRILVVFNTDRLLKLGFRVHLTPVDHINYCMLEMCGHEIFRCNLLNLQFNTHHDRDPVCQRALDAVVQSSLKFQHARLHLWLWTLIDHQLFKRGPHAPKDYWPHDIQIKPLVSCKDCVECCDIGIKKRDKDID